MPKIKFISDSSCDIPYEDEVRYGIEIKNVPLTIDGKSFMERQSFGFTEFYDVLLAAKEIPATAHITAISYMESFRNALQEGYTDVIVVPINSAGSAGYQAAHMACSLLEEEYPGYGERMKIQIIDSGTYSMGIGYPVLTGARMAEQGCSAEEITAFIRDWANSCEIYAGIYTLEFAKKSGRISSTAAFMGEVLGLRPIVSLLEKNNEVVAKVRGDKNVVPAVGELVLSHIVPKGEYIIVKGILDEPANELEALLTEKLGYGPLGVYHLGASVTINIGPRFIGAIYRGKLRR